MFSKASISGTWKMDFLFQDNGAVVVLHSERTGWSTTETSRNEKCQRGLGESWELDGVISGDPPGTIFPCKPQILDLASIGHGCRAHQRSSQANHLQTLLGDRRPLLYPMLAWRDPAPQRTTNMDFSLPHVRLVRCLDLNTVP